jgi:hypothetical protein
MSWFRNIYKLIHTFFEILSCKTKPIYIYKYDTEDYEYEYIFFPENKMSR